MFDDIPVWLTELRRNTGLENAPFIPIPRGEKGPRIPGWQAKTLADMDKPDYLNLFSESSNVGVLLGQPSNGLCVVDIDDDEWVAPFLALYPALAVTLRSSLAMVTSPRYGGLMPSSKTA